MLRYPNAQWKPLGSQTQAYMDRHDIVCFHTMAGYLFSTDSYFRTGNGKGYAGTESHYGVGGKWGSDDTYNLDGIVYQWQDRRYSADANLEGNNRIISIETADNAFRPIQPWTDKQITSLIQIGVWECSLHAHSQCPAGWTCRAGTTWGGVQVGIPPVLVPDTRSGRRGLAYHAQGAADYVAGEKWSTTMSKDCPTDIRINQLKKEIIPEIQNMIRGSYEEDDVDQAGVEQAIRNVLKLPGTGMTIPRGQKDNGDMYVNLLGMAQGNVNTVNAIRAAITAVKEDTRVSGNNESTILAKLEEIVGLLPNEPQ